MIYIIVDTDERMPRPIAIRGIKTPRVRVPYWGVVRAPVGREKFAKLNIEKAGEVAFIPRVKEGYSPVLKPLIPGYVFVRIESRWVYLRSTPGIIQVIMARGKPCRCKEDEMNSLFEAQRENGFIDLSPQIYEPMPDEKVRVQSGLFINHFVRYVGLTPEQRLRTIIELFGKEQELILRKRDIAKA